MSEAVKVSAAKRFSFCAAHFLPNYKGSCRNIHGHTWSIEVAVTGPVDSKTGMVMDFLELKGSLESLLERFDHSLLNNYLENPTAEVLGMYAWKWIKKYATFPDNVSLDWIRVWESPTAYVEIKGVKDL